MLRTALVTSLCFFFALGLPLAAALGGPVVSVDVDATVNDYVGQGVIPAVGNQWTSTSAAGIANLNDDQGNPSGIGFTRANWSNFGSIGAGGHDLMEDYVFNMSANILPGNLTLTGLSPSLVYDLVIYAAQDFGVGGRGSNVLVDKNNDGDTIDLGESVTTTGNFSFGVFSEGNTYARFLNVRPNNSGQIVVNLGPEVDNISFLNGFQITAVPEPASWRAIGVCGLAALGFVALRARRCQR